LLFNAFFDPSSLNENEKNRLLELFKELKKIEFTSTTNPLLNRFIIVKVPKQVSLIALA